MALFLRSMTLSSARRNIASKQHHHLCNTQPRRLKTRLGARVALVAGIATTAVLAFSTPGPSNAGADMSDFSNMEDSTIRSVPLTSLLRSYFVFSVCSVPALVDWSPRVISFTTSVPGLKQLAEVVVRWTFFAQFVGGDTVADCIPVIHQLRSESKGSLLVYSVEFDETKADITGNPSHGQMVEEVIRSIDTAADYEDSLSTSGGRSTWVAIKLSTLLPDSQVLLRLSQHLVRSRPPSSLPFPGSPTPQDLDFLASSEDLRTLSSTDRVVLQNLQADLFRICQRAKERQVKVVVDAEYSWYQPAVDAYTTALSQTFNSLSGDISLRPIVYGTYQAYLRRGQSHLLQSIKDAEDGNYALGVKLVRGAYHEQEAVSNPQVSISPGVDPPVYSTKVETDASFNECARILVKLISLDARKNSQPRISVLFGTHNMESCRLILSLLEQEGLAKADALHTTVSVPRSTALRISFGQLFGMRDMLTDHLATRIRSPTPVVFKYIPYGELSEVMPYLGRRAIENKTVLGNGAALAELQRIRSEIRRRILFFGS